MESLFLFQEIKKIFIKRNEIIDFGYLNLGSAEISKKYISTNNSFIIVFRSQFNDDENISSFSIFQQQNVF